MSSIIVYDAARNELAEIMAAGGQRLRLPGLALLPIKRHMLHPFTADLILEACQMLFAAILTFEHSKWMEAHSNNALDLIEARISAGTAEGVVCALFHGPTARLLLDAMDQAPIAFYAMSEASPKLKIIDRCKCCLGCNP